MLLSALLPAAARAQGYRDVLPLVLPEADRFSEREGDPALVRAYKGDRLVGYAWLTSDQPPEEMGYSGTIEVLVGMNLAGKITGVRVLDYNESLRSSRGDFLRSRGFQEQFAGKGVGDPFRVKVDVDGISGATITVAAMARSIRNTARRVATTHMSSALKLPDPIHPANATAEKLRPLSWLEMTDAGVVQRLMLLDNRDQLAVELFFLHLRDEATGRLVLGDEAWGQAAEAASARTSTDHVFMVGMDGPLGELYRATATYLVQDEDTVRMAQKDLVLLGAPTEGKIARQLTRVGVLRVDTTLVDARRPFEFVLDLRPMSMGSTMFPGLTPPPPPRRVLAEAPTPEGAAPETTASEDPAAASESTPEALADAEAAAVADAAEEDALAAELASQLAEQDLDFQFEDDAEQSVLARTLADTSWGRVAWMVALLTLASAAFALKRPGLRWATLGVTFVGLGFVDRGFLSVSHITSGIKVGPSVYLSDVPLLLLAGFTVVTTLLWGRVFCGFLCPFGALQDLMERVVPKSWRRELPRALHEKAWLVKYAVLALIVGMALAGSELSIFQYFEPFGTVFFFSPSIVLWVIAVAILAGVAIVPRFYCRYVCPLGASLAVVSTISPFRIRRVEQCTVCTVCERRCPTGAIQKEAVNFRECVRCNVCETALIQKEGVCKHDMEEIRPRLIQLQVARR